MKTIATLAFVLTATSAAFADHTAFVARPAAPQSTAPVRASSAQPYVRGQHSVAPTPAISGTAQSDAPCTPSARPYQRGQAQLQS